MKTNTIHIVFATVFAGVIALVATSKSAVDFSLLANAISYTAVAVLLGVAAFDHNRRSKNATR